MILPLVFTPIRLPGIAGKAVLTLGSHVPGTEIDVGAKYSVDNYRVLAEGPTE